MSIKDPTPQTNLIVSASQVLILINDIIDAAYAKHATTIHLEPQSAGSVVRFRVNGQMIEHSKIASELYPSVVTQLKLIANMRINNIDMPDTGRMLMHTSKNRILAVITTIPVINGEKMSIRLIQYFDENPTLESLGMNATNLSTTSASIHRAKGIMLFSSPSRSGKTQTMYSVLNLLKSPQKIITTVESQIDYRINDVDQIQLSSEVPTFSAGLESVMKQDSDVIMVAAVPDLQTAEMCMQANEANRFVLAAVSAPDAARSVLRFIMMGIEPYLVASYVSQSTSQVLVSKLCHKCRLSYMPSENEQILINQVAPATSKTKGTYFKSGKGCDNCSNGYNGQIGLFETLRVSEVISRLIVARASASDIRDQAISEGMITMRHDGILKAQLGYVNLSDVIEATHRAETFR